VKLALGVFCGYNSNAARKSAECSTKFFLGDGHRVDDNYSTAAVRSQAARLHGIESVADNPNKMNELEAFMEEVRKLVDAKLDELVPAKYHEPTRLYQAIRWSLFGNGKRFRPVLVFASGRIFGASDDLLLRTAAAVEMIHTYSLIHDDLPAMDDDDLRRGRATAHRKFDEATAILAGDALQAMAFQVIAEDELLSAATRVELVSGLTSAAAAMVAGQQLDLEAEGQKVTTDGLEQIHLMKTGALIAFSVKSAALIAEASPEEVLSAERFGLKLGLLFQITDDLLDLTQSTETLGKTAKKDVASQKATYPSLFGVEETKRLAEKVQTKAIEGLNAVAKNAHLLREIADYIIYRES